jgi:hypothetical protein
VFEVQLWLEPWQIASAGNSAGLWQASLQKWQGTKVCRTQRQRSSVGVPQQKYCIISTKKVSKLVEAIKLNFSYKRERRAYFPFVCA